MKGTTQHKKRVTNSHNREFISLGASSLFLFEATMIWQSEITPCNVCGWLVNVCRKWWFSLHPQIWFMPDGQTNGKRKERFLPFTLCVKEPRLIISSVSIMMIIYLCFSKHDLVFTLHLSLSFLAQCVSAKKHISQHWLFIVSQPAWVLGGSELGSGSDIHFKY